MANSLIGRLVGYTTDTPIYEVALIAESANSFSERQKRELRDKFAELSKRITESLRSAQQ